MSKSSYNFRRWFSEFAYPVLTLPPPPAGQSPSPAAQASVPAPAGRQREQTPSNKAAARGTIAYIRGGTEIRLIESDGTNDRRLWTHEFAKEGSGIHDLAWRPDGKELAFSSSHLNAASFYNADIYAVGPDGKGFRIHKFSSGFARRFAGKLCFSGPEPRHAVVFNLPDKKNRARMIIFLCFERL